MAYETSSLGKKKVGFLDSHFHLTERGTTAGAEIGEGLKASLLIMCFFVINTRIVSQSFTDVTISSLYMGISLIAAIGTLAIGLIANLPLVQTVGMVTSTMFVTMAARHTGLTYQNLLFISLIAAIVYAVVMVSPLKRLALKLLPLSVRKALPAALGLIVVLVSLIEAGIVKQTATGLAVISLADVTGPQNGGLFPGFICAIVAVVLYVILSARGSKAPATSSFIAATVIFFLLALYSEGSDTVYALNRLWFVGSEDAYNIARAFSETSWGAVFVSGLDFSAYTAASGNMVGVIAQGIMLFMLMNALGSDASLQAIQAEDLAEETVDDDSKNTGKVLAINALTNIVAPLLGSMPTSVSPSSVVLSTDRAKTGLASVACAFGFLVASLSWVFFMLTATWTDVAVEWYYGHFGQCLEYYVTASFAIACAVLFATGVRMVASSLKGCYESVDDGVAYVATLCGALVSTDLVLGAAAGAITYALRAIFVKDAKREGLALAIVGALIGLAYIVLVLL